MHPAQIGTRPESERRVLIERKKNYTYSHVIVLRFLFPPAITRDQPSHTYEYWWLFPQFSALSKSKSIVHHHFFFFIAYLIRFNRSYRTNVEMYNNVFYN